MTTSGLRIRNLIRATTAIRQSLGVLAGRWEHAPASDRAAGQAALHLRIAELVQQVEVLCLEAGTAPGALPAPSRRAYAWLRLLKTPAHLLAHLEALAAAARLARRLNLAWSPDPAAPPPPRKGLKAKLNPQPGRVQFEFYYQGALLRADRRKETLTVTAHPGFVFAPQAVLEALLLGGLQGLDKTRRTRLRTFAAGPEFAAVVQALELPLPAAPALPPPDAPAGDHHDLEASFRRVNAAYFQGGLARPRLEWSSRRTRRMLGRYTPATDTVTISRSLDHPNVPAFALDSVMHHELLHKALGYRQSNGRRTFHTAEFRRAEALFEKRAEVEAFLAEFLGREGQ